MDINYKLQKYYVSYLSNIKNLSVKSINNYLIALNAISRFLNKKNLIFGHIFEIYDIIKLEELRSLLYKDKDFIVINNRGHHMYSAGLNNYCNFANGLEFDKVHDKIKYMDMPIKANSERYKMLQLWGRSNIMRKQTIELALYKCEIDATHKSFIAESTQQMYMEGHHAIPLHFQPQFENSLDVYANIVCLCPLCHKQIHHGLKQDRIQLMNMIYELRAERLNKSGIHIDQMDFVQMAL